MRVTVHFNDGENLDGDVPDISLQKLGFTLTTAGANSRTVWVAMPAIKYVVVHEGAGGGGEGGDPRATAGMPKVVFHFGDGETLRTYRDQHFHEEGQGFQIRVWEPKSKALQRVMVSAHALKGVFYVDDWDSRSDDDKRADVSKRRHPAQAEVPTAWIEEAADEFDPETRALAHTYRNRLALERDLELSSTDPVAFEREIANRLDRILDDDLIAMSADRRHQLVTYIMRESIGYGPLDPLLRDPLITDIMVNAPDEVYIERDGQIMRTQTRFEDNGHLLNVIRRMCATIGRRVDESTPMVDARLPDGTRINAVIPPAATRGPNLTIRKFMRHLSGLDHLIGQGTLSPPMANFLQSAVEGRCNLLISGGTGCGKTTTMNVLGALTPHKQRIVTIEDSAELQLGHPHVVSLEFRPANIEGKGELSIRALLRNSLRMRPDRVMVGEVRDAAAIDMLQAMNTGHDGSMSTIHANSARDAFSRLEVMVLSGSVDIPLSAVRAQIASALNIVCHQTRMPDGSRKIIQISEVTGYEGDTPILSDIFRYHRTEDGTAVFEPTGNVPEVSIVKMNFYGVDVDRAIFKSMPVSATTPGGASYTPDIADAPRETDGVDGAEVVAPAPEASPEVAEAAQVSPVQMAMSPEEIPSGLGPDDLEPEPDSSSDPPPKDAPLQVASSGALNRRRQQRGSRR